MQCCTKHVWKLGCICVVHFIIYACRRSSVCQMALCWTEWHCITCTVILLCWVVCVCTSESKWRCTWLTSSHCYVSVRGIEYHRHACTVLRHLIRNLSSSFAFRCVKITPYNKSVAFCCSIFTLYWLTAVLIHENVCLTKKGLMQKVAWQWVRHLVPQKVF